MFIEGFIFELEKRSQDDFDTGITGAAMGPINPMMGGVGLPGMTPGMMGMPGFMRRQRMGMAATPETPAAPRPRITGGNDEELF